MFGLGASALFCNAASAKMRALKFVIGGLGLASGCEGLRESGCRV